MEFIEFIWQNIRSAMITDVIDILIVAYLLYRAAKLIKDTSAARIIRGVLVLLVMMQVAEWLHLNTISYVFKNTMTWGIIVLAIVFQPELRRILEQMGKSKLSSIIADRDGGGLSDIESAVVQTVEACSSMSWSRTGALMVFERTDTLSEIVKTGTHMDAEASAELIKNVFYPKAPLHDGAMILREGRILSAGCVLPLSGNQTLSRDLGTRHRAAVGMSEASDSVCVVVSEETGSISVAIGGMLKRHLAPETLMKLLKNELLPQEDDADKKKSVLGIWKGKSK